MQQVHQTTSGITNAQLQTTLSNYVTSTQLQTELANYQLN